MAQVSDEAIAVAEWVFRRGHERLVVRREFDGETVCLAVGPPTDTRQYSFPSVDRLVAFQSDMESFLVRTGWTLQAFAPERRTGGDRRRMPRIENDRRRWWTDVFRADPRGDALSE